MIWVGRSHPETPEALGGGQGPAQGLFCSWSSHAGGSWLGTTPHPTDRGAPILLNALFLFFLLPYHQETGSLCATSALLSSTGPAAPTPPSHRRKAEQTPSAGGQDAALHRGQRTRRRGHARPLPSQLSATSGLEKGSWDCGVSLWRENSHFQGAKKPPRSWVSLFPLPSPCLGCDLAD